MNGDIKNVLIREENKIEILYRIATTLSEAIKKTLDTYKKVRRYNNIRLMNMINQLMHLEVEAVKIWLQKLEYCIQECEIYLYRAARKMCKENNLKSCRDWFKELRRDVRDCVETFLKLYKILNKISQEKKSAKKEDIEKAIELIKKFKESHEKFLKEFKPFFEVYQYWIKRTFTERKEGFDIEDLIKNEEKILENLNKIEEYIKVLWNLLLTLESLKNTTNTIKFDILSSRNPEGSLKDIRKHIHNLQKTLYEYKNRLSWLINYEEQVAKAMWIVTVLSYRSEEIFESDLPKIIEALEYLRNEENYKKLQGALNTLKEKLKL